MAVVFLALGSNLGNRRKNIRLALDQLEKKSIIVERLSTVIETDPVGGPPQGKFLNAVLKATTRLSPLELLSALKSIERDLGRTSTVRNGPRIMDIDILLYDNLTMNSSELIIPHPQMFERPFVMTPLEEIEPQLAKELFHAHHRVD